MSTLLVFYASFLVLALLIIFNVGLMFGFLFDSTTRACQEAVTAFDHGIYLYFMENVGVSGDDVNALHLNMIRECGVDSYLFPEG